MITYKFARLKYRQKALRELRTLPTVQAELDRRARRIAEFGGDGFLAGEVRTTRGRGRARTIVSAYTRRAQAKNAREHTLMNGLSRASGDVG